MLPLSAVFSLLASHATPTNLPVFPSLPLPFSMIPFFKPTSGSPPCLSQHVSDIDTHNRPPDYTQSYIIFQDLNYPPERYPLPATTTTT